MNERIAPLKPRKKKRGKKDEDPVLIITAKRDGLMRVYDQLLKQIEGGDCQLEAVRMLQGLAGEIRQQTGELRRLEKHNREKGRALTPPERARRAIELVKTLPAPLRGEVYEELGELVNNQGALSR